MRRLPALATLLIAAAASGLAQASNQPPNPGQVPQPVPIGPVFVYVYEPGQMNPSGDPLQQLREARITTSGPRRAYDIKTLGDNTGDGSPEEYRFIAAAPGNRLAVAYSVQTPIDSIDHDLRVFDLAQHKLKRFFNEHTLQPLVHRSTCDSHQLDAMIAKDAAMGVPQSQLDTYDYQLSVDGQDAGNVPDIALIEWVNNATVHLQWPMKILMGPPGGRMEAMETFDFQVKVTNSGPQPILVSCSPPASLQAPPRPVFKLSPGGKMSTQAITLDGVTLSFPPIFKSGPPKRSYPRTADMAAGNIPKTGPYAAP